VMRARQLCPGVVGEGPDRIGRGRDRAYCWGEGPT
jgi:hypothetical protein